MKRDERRQRIMDVLVADGEVQLEALSLRFDVSRMTIHRDLDELESEGLLRKIRGGATIRSGTRFESDFRFRERQGAEAKAAMGAGLARPRGAGHDGDDQRRLHGGRAGPDGPREAAADGDHEQCRGFSRR